MRSNSMKTCAVGAMLFGGTLGAASTAQAGLVFTNAGVAPTLNYAYNYDGSDTFTFTDRGFSAVSTSLSGLIVAWSATTDASGFSTTVTPSGSFDVTTTRTFTVTGTQQVSFSWSGSYSIKFGIVTGPLPFAPVPDLGPGWGTNASGSVTNAASGSVTVTLAAGNYQISSGLNAQATAGGASFFNFVVVPAPGAVALLGAAGLVSSRRRRR